MTPLPRRFEGTGTAQLLRLHCIQNGTNAAWCYDIRDAAGIFRVNFPLPARWRNRRLAIAIFSLTGTELAGCTTHQESPIDRLSPGQYAMRITVPDLCTESGNLHFWPWASDSGRGVDHILEAHPDRNRTVQQSMPKGLHKFWASLDRCRYESSTDHILKCHSFTVLDKATNRLLAAAWPGRHERVDKQPWLHPEIDRPSWPLLDSDAGHQSPGEVLLAISRLHRPAGTAGIAPEREISASLPPLTSAQTSATPPASSNPRRTFRCCASRAMISASAFWKKT